MYVRDGRAPYSLPVYLKEFWRVLVKKWTISGHGRNKPAQLKKPVEVQYNKKTGIPLLTNRPYL